MTHKMSSALAEQWGMALAEAACSWAYKLAPETVADGIKPHIIMMVLDTKGVLQAWFALWPLPNEHLDKSPHPLRIVKCKAFAEAKLSGPEDGIAMAEVERYIRTVKHPRRYWLVWNGAKKRYRDFQE